MIENKKATLKKKLPEGPTDLSHHLAHIVSRHGFESVTIEDMWVAEDTVTYVIRVRGQPLGKIPIPILCRYYILLHIHGLTLTFLIITLL